MLHEVVNVVGPLICGAVIVFQGFKYRQLKQKLKIAQITPNTVGYLQEARKNMQHDIVVLVMENNNCYVLYGSKPESETLTKRLENHSCIAYGIQKLPTKEELLVKEKQNLIEERKKLLLMEEFLAKKEQAIIEMEVQQELDS